MSNVKSVRPHMDAVTMELGGKVRTLQFDMNAFAELENRYGSVEEAMNQLSKGRIADVRTILWTALIHEETVVDEVTGEPKGYNITPFQVGSWIKNPSMLAEASQKLGDAMGNDMPAPEDIPDEVAQKLAESGFELGPEGLKKKEEAKND